jgi:multidrug resistance efflux pump
MTRNRILTVAAVMVLAGGGLTVLMAAREPGDKAAAPAKPQAALVCLGTVDTEDKMIGIYPDNFPLSSQVLKVLVKEGEEVKAGQKLLEMDTGPLELKVREAAIGIVKAKATLAKAEAAVRTHAIEVNSLEKTWKAKQAALKARQNELEEVKRLVELKGKVKADQDIAEAALLEAELNLDAAKIKLDGMRGETPNYLVDEAKQGVEHAENLKAQAERALAQVSCTTKADGWIVRSFVSEGSSFGPMSREPAFWFVKKGPPLVRAEVTQEFASRISQGQAAVIEDEADASQQWTGRVSKVGDRFLPKRHANGNGLDIFPVNSDPVLECLVSIDAGSGKAAPKFGQKVRVSLPKK